MVQDTNFNIYIWYFFCVATDNVFKLEQSHKIKSYQEPICSDIDWKLYNFYKQNIYFQLLNIEPKSSRNKVILVLVVMTTSWGCGNLKEFGSRMLREELREKSCDHMMLPAINWHFLLHSSFRLPAWNPLVKGIITILEERRLKRSREKVCAQH